MRRHNGLSPRHRISMYLGLFAEVFLVPYDCDMLRKLLHMENGMPKNRQGTADLVTFTEEILEVKLYFFAQ